MYSLLITNKNYSSWSLRPWVLMRGLGIEFEEVLIPLGERPPGGSIAERSPSGRVPCLVDRGLTLWDSMAIIEYLAERHAGVWPDDANARAWARCAAAEMHSSFFALRAQCSMSCGVRVARHEVSVPLQEDLARIDALWREGLSRHGGPFLAGSRFTAVDAFFAPVAFRVRSYGLSLSRDAMDYVGRLLALGPMQDWHAAALLERWREAGHEEEVRCQGAVIEDLRAT
ncbi:MAG: hypothetical protein RLZZ200_931 [Pseudomonadota bacterium]|jgi:glutathione S-transferase